MSFFKKEKDEEGKEEFVPVWQMFTEELKEIIGEFENQIKEHSENIPNTPEGKLKAVKDKKLPDCGWWRLADRGIVAWYLENGWLASWPPKDGKKRQWAITDKYVADEISQKEQAIDLLESRRAFAQEKEFEVASEIIKSM